jgi:SAM-dependent methyltransferase
MKMKVFKDYADFYDSLYEDKNYQEECNFVKHVFETYSEKKVNSILDLGCGTGSHALPFADMGYAVTGVDLSENMLEIARKKVGDQKKQIIFVQQDIKHLKLPQKFDAAVALFAVMGYQTTNEDLKTTFVNIKNYLNSGGLFVFDCWYGPAVLSDRPAVRIKRMEDEEIAVTRIAEPVMYPNENCVDVNYQVFIKDKASGSVEELHECHRMRYLFMPEIQEFFASAELEMVAAYEWMTNQKPGFDTWSVCFVGRRL